MSKTPILIAAIAGGLLALFALKRHRSKPQSRMERLRHGVEGALDEIETGIGKLNKEAKKARGEARTQLEQRAKDLEARKQELRGHLENIRTEARHLVESARP